jgi:hypothetical protein
MSAVASFAGHPLLVADERPRDGNFLHNHRRPRPSERHAEPDADADEERGNHRGVDLEGVG